MATYQDVLNQFSPTVHFRMSNLSGGDTITDDINGVITYSSAITTAFASTVSLLKTDLSDDALVGNGTSKLSASATSDLDLKNGTSISFLFARTGSLSSTDHEIISAAAGSTFSLYMDTANGTRLAIAYTGSTTLDLISPLYLDQTHHIIVTKHTGGIRVYVDGMLAADMINANVFSQKITTVLDQAKASIDELCFHNHEFNAADALKLFTATKSQNITINGTISESLVATDFKVVAHRTDTGDITASTVTSTGAFSLIVPDIPHYVVALAEQGVRHETSHTYAVGEKVYPEDTISYPFYYECSTAGTSGVTSPAWNTGVATTTADGTVIWSMVEHLIQPIAHSPITS